MILADIDTAALIPATLAQLRGLRAYAETDLTSAERTQVQALIESAKGALITLHILHARKTGAPMDCAIDSVCGVGSYARIVSGLRPAA
jgi:hypothetical protein